MTAAVLPYWAWILTSGILALALALAFIRTVLGPTLADRVNSIDLVALASIGLALVFVLYTGERAYLDLALVFAVLAFLGGTAFARYAERREP